MPKCFLIVRGVSFQARDVSVGAGKDKSNNKIIEKLIIIIVAIIVFLLMPSNYKAKIR